MTLFRKAFFVLGLTIPATASSTLRGARHLKHGKAGKADKKTSKSIVAPTAPTTCMQEVVCARPEFEILCQHVQTSGLVLGGEVTPTLTLFAPTNEAFQKLPPEIITAIGTDTDLLLELLRSHMAPGAVHYDDLVCVGTTTMVSGDDTTTYCDNREKYQVGPRNTPIAMPRIVKSDTVVACDGVIHTIDNVMLPGFLIPAPTAYPTASPTTSNAPTTCQTIEDIVCDGNRPEFRKFCELAREDKVDLEREDGLTLFAPTDDAWMELPPSIVALMAADPTLLSKILLSHVTQDELTCYDTLSMVNKGEAMLSCNATGKYLIGAGISVIQLPDPIVACNGVIHVIDQVFLAPNHFNYHAHERYFTVKNGNDSPDSP